MEMQYCKWSLVLTWMDGLQSTNETLLTERFWRQRLMCMNSVCMLYWSGKHKRNCNQSTIDNVETQAELGIQDIGQRENKKHNTEN